MSVHYQLGHKGLSPLQWHSIVWGGVKQGLQCCPDKNALSRIMIPLYNVVGACVLLALNEMNVPRSQVTIFLIIN
jgi:hypothetical protein